MWGVSTNQWQDRWTRPLLISHVERLYTCSCDTHSVSCSSTPSSNRLAVQRALDFLWKKRKECKQRSWEARRRVCRYRTPNQICRATLEQTEMIEHDQLLSVRLENTGRYSDVQVAYVVYWLCHDSRTAFVWILGVKPYANTCSTCH